MTFSNIDVFRNTVQTLRTSEANSVPNRVKGGGAFSPTTFEAVALSRSELDNQWENSYIIKYQALMQNRLNRLKQDLTNSYKSLLDQSSVQQIRENGSNSANSATTNVYGQMIGGSKDATGATILDPTKENEAFRGLHYFDSQTEFDKYDGYGSNSADQNKTSSDGVPSYYIRDKLTQYDGAGNALPTNVAGGASSGGMGSYEMRKLYVNGPALQITNTMKVTMRTEEVPPKKVDQPLPGIAAMNYTAGEKVAEYSTDVKSGGYWSTLNYLYNFAPRELKYSYPTAYSTTTEETGTRQLDANGNTQALLYEKKVLDTRDAERASKESDNVPEYTASSKPPAGSRIKFVSSNANDGYLTERSASYNIAKDSEGKSNVDTGDDRAITRRTVSNDNEFSKLTTTYAKADSTIKGTYLLAPDGSNGKDKTEYGNDEFANGSVEDRVKFTYQHDGINSADLNRDATGSGAIANTDVHVAKAAFLNHYIVQTQDIELNSSSNSYGIVRALGFDTTGTNTNAKITDDFYNNAAGTGAIKGDYTLLRSTGIDGSADHVFNDAGSPGNNLIDNTPDEKLLLPGSGKIAKGFDGKFVSRQYQIKSFNGQNIATDNANINISSETTANPVIIAQYEGFKRAQSMSRGIATDDYSKASNSPLPQTQANDLVTQIQSEINATSMVDTDWHYSEYTKQYTDPAAKDSIMFKQVKAVNFTATTGGAAGKVAVEYRNDIVDNDKVFNNVAVAFRKSFTLDDDDFLRPVYASNVSPNSPFDPNLGNALFVDTPAYVPRDVFVDLATTGVPTNPLSTPPGEPIDLVVNGKVVPPTTLGGTRYNLKGFLLKGDNVISAQMKFYHDKGATGTINSFKLTAAPLASGNDKQIVKWLDNRVSTERSKNSDSVLDARNSSSINNKSISTWQSKIMVHRIDPAYFNSIFPASSTNTIDPQGNTPGAGVYIDPTTGLGITWASDKAYQEYINGLNLIGSVNTATKVKNNNSFALALTDALNKKDFQDIYNLGLLNTGAGKTMTIKAQVTAPTNGTLNATMDIQYDPVNNKFILVQNKFDAFSGV